MTGHTELIATLAVGLSAALVAGLIASKLRLPTIVGYLVAGMIVGPFTPGFIADTRLAPQLAEIGVILLMFGVGSHFSLPDLLRVRWVAIPGAVAQLVIITLAGAGLGLLAGWSWGEGLVFGLAISVASTVVMLRALTEAGRLDDEAGRIGLGWLVVEDLLVIVLLVALPLLSGVLGGTGGEAAGWGLVLDLTLTIGKVALFVALMLTVGVKVVPWFLDRVRATGSVELFVLATLALALGIAYGAAVAFDVSFALGAFLAGLVVAESASGHEAMKVALPLREAFAVLFFVSVGMVLDPAFLLREPARILAVVAVVVGGKAVVVWTIARLARRPMDVALVLGAGRAQIGEFSFVLSEAAARLGLMSEEGRNLVLAAALVSIVVNPLLFAGVRRWTARGAAPAGPDGPAAIEQVGGPVAGPDTT